VARFVYTVHITHSNTNRATSKKPNKTRIVKMMTILNILSKWGSSTTNTTKLRTKKVFKPYLLLSLIIYVSVLNWATNDEYFLNLERQSVWGGENGLHVVGKEFDLLNKL